MATSLPPPNNIEAEQALLGSILMDPDVLLLPELRDVKPDSFYLEKHAYIFEVLLTLCEKQAAIDNITVAHELDQRGHLTDIGGDAYLIALLQATPTAIHAPDHANIVLQTAYQRELLSVSGEIAAIAYEPCDREEMESKAHQALMKLNATASKRDGLSLADAITDFMPELNDLIEGKRDIWGVPTGLVDLDAYIGGLAYGEMTLIASDPGMGKTTLATTIAFNAACKGYCGIVFSLEMRRSQLMLRFFAEQADVDTATIRRGKMKDHEIDRMWHNVDRIHGIPLWIYDEPKDTGAIQRDIMRTQRMLEAQDQTLDFAIIDYSDLLTDKAETEVVRQKHLSHNLKTIAKRTGVALGVVHTITRDANASEKPPDLNHLGWGRAWEFDAHTVLFPWWDKNRNSLLGLIKVGKYRDGIPNQKIDVLFDGRRWANIVKPK